MACSGLVDAVNNRSPSLDVLSLNSNLVLLGFSKRSNGLCSSLTYLGLDLSTNGCPTCRRTAAKLTHELSSRCSLRAMWQMLPFSSNLVDLQVLIDGSPSYSGPYQYLFVDQLNLYLDYRCIKPHRR